MDLITKKCPKCDRVLPLSDYFRNRSAHLGVQAYCKPCLTLKVKEYDARHPEQKLARYRRAARRQLAKRYGLTVADLDVLLASQDGKCAICREPEVLERQGRLRRIVLDHDHSSGKPRAYLCNLCNRGLGLFRDNPTYLRRAANYLGRYAAVTD